MDIVASYANFLHDVSVVGALVEAVLVLCVCSIRCGLMFTVLCMTACLLPLFPLVSRNEQRLFTVMFWRLNAARLNSFHSFGCGNSPFLSLLGCCLVPLTQDNIEQVIIICKDSCAFNYNCKNMILLVMFDCIRQQF